MSDDNTMRSKLFGGLAGAAIGMTFSAISTMALLMPPRGAEPKPLRDFPLTAVYAYLAYRNAREFGRTYRLINQQPEASAQQGYERLSSIHWTLGLTGGSYAVRALMPETQLAKAAVDGAITASLVWGAYHCRNKARMANSPP